MKKSQSLGCELKHTYSDTQMDLSFSFFVCVNVSAYQLFDEITKGIKLYYLLLSLVGFQFSI